MLVSVFAYLTQALNIDFSLLTYAPSGYGSSANNLPVISLSCARLTTSVLNMIGVPFS